MIMEIGITAGEIWRYLESAGPVSMDTLYHEIKREKELILMSLGWLAREGHVVVDPAGDFSEYRVSLRGR